MGDQHEVVGDDHRAVRENDTQRTGKNENVTIVMWWKPVPTRSFCARHCVRHGAVM